MKQTNKALLRVTKLSAITRWSLTYLFPGQPTLEQMHLINKSEIAFAQKIRNKGLVEAISSWKGLRVKFKGFLTSGDIRGLEFLISPDILAQIEHPNTKRLMLTILDWGRGFRGNSAPNTQPLISACTGDAEAIWFTSWVKVFLCELGIRPDPLVWKGPHISSKAGPQGPAMATAYADLEALDPEMLLSIKDLNEDLYGYIQYQQEFAGDQRYLASRLKMKKTRAGLTRTLTWIPDKELKVRIVAMFDYWSQAALLPLHDSLFGILRRFGTDFTFNQEKGLDYLLKVKESKPGHSFHSLDLSSATDRFPIGPQKKILSLFYGAKIADAWESLLVSKPFTPLWDKQTLIQYSVGQPMGAYSSWAAFTLTHHLLVRYCARDMDFEDYAILGDDIVIVDDVVSKEYERVIQLLGVEISGPKSIHSPELFEFSRRVFHKGNEVSPSPVNSLLENKRVATLSALDVVFQQGKKGYKPRLGWFNKQMVFDLCGWPLTEEYNPGHNYYKYWKEVMLFPLLEPSKGEFLNYMKYIDPSIGCNTRHETAESWFFKALRQILVNATMKAGENSADVSNPAHIEDAFNQHCVDEGIAMDTDFSVKSHIVSLAVTISYSREREKLIDLQLAQMKDDWDGVDALLSKSSVPEPLKILRGFRTGTFETKHGHLIKLIRRSWQGIVFAEVIPKVIKKKRSLYDDDDFDLADLDKIGGPPW